MMLYVGGFYLLIVLATYLFQRRLLYLPDRGRPSSAQLEQLGLRFWPADTNEYRALISVDNPPDSIRSTVIVFHGNAGAAWHRHYYIDALGKRGLNVLLAEFPGYGGRDGAMSETAFVKDAGMILKRAYREFGDPLYLWGESMGCGVVAALAADPLVPIEGLILLTPWDTLGDLAQRHYPFLPARYLLKDRYNNLENLKDFDKPVAVLVAEYDQVIPNPHSLRLYKSLNAPKRLWTFEGAGHNTWPVAPDALWWDEVVAFLTAAQ